MKVSFKSEHKETQHKQLLLSVALSAKKEIISTSYEATKLSKFVIKLIFTHLYELD